MTKTTDHTILSKPEPGLPVILADGAFPNNDDTLAYLKKAQKIICCDGAIHQLEKIKILPDMIVGDLDSISPAEKEKYSDRLYQDSNQDTNDLTKAMQWCLDHNIREVVVLGATGKREDHTLGNIGLLAEHCHRMIWSFLTDYGWFVPIRKSSTIQSKAGQQVSIFCFDPQCSITSSGLKYPLIQRQFKLPWEGTLNEAEKEHFSLTFEKGEIVVYLANEPRKQ